MKRRFTNDELLQYSNHPLVGCKNICPKCKGNQICLPAYPEDYFDCMDCGHSMPPTQNQINKMNRKKPKN